MTLTYRLLGIVWIVLMSPFSWQCQNLCLLSLALITDWRVVCGYVSAAMSVQYKICKRKCPFELITFFANYFAKLAELITFYLNEKCPLLYVHSSEFHFPVVFSTFKKPSMFPQNMWICNLKFRLEMWNTFHNYY